MCPLQEICQHYSNNTKRRNHDIRLKNPCIHWLAFDCEKMSEVLVVNEFCTGRVTACDLEKMRRLKGE